MRYEASDFIKTGGCGELKQISRTPCFAAGAPRAGLEKTPDGFFTTYALPVEVKDNVWIGGGSILLPGVTIGENSVIGAGSVVNRPIPANCVAVGNPCRVIRYFPAGKERGQYEV